MTGYVRPGSWQLVRDMLAASKSRIGTGSSTFLLPAFVALADLLFCVLFEDPIKQDPSGRSLSTFLFIQGILIFLLTLAHVMGTTLELLRKSLVMPLTPSARLAFAILSPARHPVLLALVFTNVFFLLVVYHPSVVAIIAIPLLTLLMAANLIALTSLASAAAVRRSRPPTIVAAYAILAILGILVIALLFRVPAAIGLIPPVSWTTQGILAIVSGQIGLALLCGMAGVILLLLTGILGRRFV